MKKLGSLFLLLIVLAVSGCKAIPNLVPSLEWTRIPEAPEYTVEAPIPLRMGVIMLDNFGNDLDEVSMPPLITDARVINVSYSEASNHKNDIVRWGGVITDIENEENHILIQVQFYPLNESGFPQLVQPSVRGW
jgi:starvation-inducible outer membrane lipoprotein